MGAMPYQVGERVRSLISVDGVLNKGDILTIVQLNISEKGEFDAEINGRHVALLPDQVEVEHPAKWIG
jgi:hypothetical protein